MDNVSNSSTYSSTKILIISADFSSPQTHLQGEEKFSGFTGRRYPEEQAVQRTVLVWLPSSEGDEQRGQVQLKYLKEFKIKTC